MFSAMCLFKPCKNQSHNHTFSEPVPAIKDRAVDRSILAILLGISDADNGRIMKDNHDSAQKQHQAFVKAWLENGKTYWAILVSALRHKLVKQRDCANEIAKNHSS